MLLYEVFLIIFFNLSSTGLVKNYIPQPLTYKLIDCFRFHVAFSTLYRLTSKQVVDLIIYLLGVLCHFQHCTGHIMTGSSMGRGNQYIQLVKILYCKLPTIGKELQTFPHKVWGLNCQPQRWEVRLLPLCHHGPKTGGRGG